jgi:segregation and condensation protein B
MAEAEDDEAVAEGADARAADGEPASEQPLAPPDAAAADAAAPDEARGDEIAEEPPALAAAELQAILEALIFASPNPLTPREITQVLEGVPRPAWSEALDQLRAEYARDGRGLQLVDVAGGYQITTRPEHNDWIRALLDPKTPTRLSIQALQTLAVIAYKQPVTLPEIIELRGVKSGGVIKTLLERHLIRIVGRKEVVGRPILYGTTKEFLLHFGLKDLSELPKLEEFAEVLGEEIDVAGLRKAIDAPRPVELPLSDEEPVGEDAGAEPAPPAEADAATPPGEQQPPAREVESAAEAEPAEGEPAAEDDPRS